MKKGRNRASLEKFVRNLVLELDGIKYGVWSLETVELIQAIKRAVQRARAASSPLKPTKKSHRINQDARSRVG